MEGGAEQDHLLQIRELSAAFTAYEILCSPVHTEAITTKKQQSEFVNRVCKLANKADVIVLDWKMEDEKKITKGTTAQAIIDRLKVGNPGREVLVCIFSAEPSDIVKADDLSKENVCVFYVSKTGVKAYEELPNKICCKFSERHIGLLPAAALSAVKVIRDNTHRLLFKYSSENDAAYLSHRCLVENVEDAELFVTELLAASLGDLIRGNNKVINTVNDQHVTSWLDLRGGTFKVDDFEMPGIIKRKITNKVRKEWLNKGISNWLVKLSNSRKDPKLLKQKMKKWDSSHSLSLVKYFLNNVELDKAISIEADFSMLASHIFFDDSGKNINSNFVSLGSVIKNTKSKDKYYLCLQPVCDSVRLNGGKIPFLFLSLKKCDKPTDARSGFHIVVKENNNDVFLKISENNSHLKVIELVPDVSSKKVVSKTKGLIKGYINGQENEFSLLAQLRREHAHRISTKFIHNVTRVGLNEPEWLRRHGTV